MDPQYLFALLFGALLCGIQLERWRALWAKRRWLKKQGIAKGNANSRNFPFRKRAPSRTGDAAAQLRTVMHADFEKKPILSKSEARFLYAAEKAVKDENLNWRVMAQVSLGEVLSSPDDDAYAAINSKRVDLLLISSRGDPIAAIEYQGDGHYQGSAAARDAVKKEALRRAGVRYIEVTPEHNPDELGREIFRIARAGRTQELAE